MKPPKSPKTPRIGRVYKIWNVVDDKIYVGSTFQDLSHRFRDHKNCTNSRINNMKLYCHIRKIGIDNFRIELIQEYMVITTQELRKYEGEWIRELNSELNKIIAGRTIKQYRTENNDKIVEHKKKYYNQNKDKIVEYNKQYRTENKNKIAKCTKIKCMCPCGAIGRAMDYNRHIQTKRHQEYMLFGGLENINI